VNKKNQELNLEKENSLDPGPESGFNESGSTALHCNENPIYVFPEKELCGLSPNYHIHVFV
jgi:hypothetical protein